MSVIDLIKEWSGTVLLIGGSIWGLVEIYYKWIAKSEDTKQEKHHTEQEKLTTEEKELDLDSRRVEKSEEVASKALEHLAEAREENLELLEDKYELSKALRELTAKTEDNASRLQVLEEAIAQLQEERSVIAYFFCGNLGCKIREPKLGGLQLSCLSMETLKQMMQNGQNA